MSEGKRWVEALGEKAWAPGMLATRLECATTWYRILRCVDDTGVPSVWTDEDGDIVNAENGVDDFPDDAIPDLNDGATLGAMLAIVRGLSDPTAPLVPTWSKPGPVLTWCLLDREGRVLGEGPSEGAALVAAAEAWRRELTATTTNRGDHREETKP